MVKLPNNQFLGGGTMTLQILGSGCPKCQKLADNAQAAIEQTGAEATVEKVTDTDTIADMGVMMTPALAIDGKVQASGTVLSVEKITELLNSQ
jgi:small redox-active disulfide protein 2